ncbi:MAG TPA: hypothetical protein VM888_13340 [Chitinophagaceae bacterium]|nr:hypothetical protein [Chitinophagaceae bacterium]
MPDTKPKIPLIVFDPAGARLKIEWKARSGVYAASYEILLWESNSNDVISRFQGNNINDEDDKYDLPLPTEKNHQRLLDVLTRVTAYEDNTNYNILITVTQGGKKIFEDFCKPAPDKLLKEAETHRIQKWFILTAK